MNERSAEQMIDSKVIAAAVTAYITPIVGGFLAARLGVDIEASTATTFLAPLVLAVATFAAGYVKRDERIGAFVDFYRQVTIYGQEDPEPEEGLTEDEIAEHNLAEERPDREDPEAR